MPKLYWRGSPSPNGSLRGHFVAKALSAPWADVARFYQFDKAAIQDNIRPSLDSCRYRFTLYVLGNAWNGAGKYVYLCRSIFITHHLE